MKENILGPRQWAFVVITGGAACALPFLQTDNPPTKTDNASTSSQQDASLDPRYTLGRPVGPGGPLAAPSSVSEIVPPLPPPRVPEWANAAFSPFDDLVGATAATPEATPPRDQLPMQPLRPWIAGPDDAPASLAATSTQARPAAGAHASEGAIAKGGQTGLEASPWSRETAGFAPSDQLANSSRHSPPSDKAASFNEANQWPDQAVSAEEIAQVTRSRDRELASAIAPSPQSPSSHSSPLLAAPALPSTTPTQAISTVPVAAQRFGQAYMPPEVAKLRAPTIGVAQSDKALPKDLNLPPLPATRKSHIIFQPGNWK